MLPSSFWYNFYFTLCCDVRNMTNFMFGFTFFTLFALQTQCCGHVGSVNFFHTTHMRSDAYFRRPTARRTNSDLESPFTVRPSRRYTSTEMLRFDHQRPPPSDVCARITDLGLVVSASPHRKRRLKCRPFRGGRRKQSRVIPVPSPPPFETNGRWPLWCSTG